MAAGVSRVHGPLLAPSNQQGPWRGAQIQLVTAIKHRPPSYAHHYEPPDQLMRQDKPSGGLVEVGNLKWAWNMSRAGHSKLH